jgi:hypothetical protein
MVELYEYNKSNIAYVISTIKIKKIKINISQIDRMSSEWVTKKKRGKKTREKPNLNDDD